MSVLDKARELGVEISRCNELINMREAEVMMLQNSEAQEIIKEFNEKQRAFQMIQSQGQQLTEGQKQEAEELEKKMLDNPYIYNFFKAQQTFEKVLEDINKIIGEAIGSGSGCGCESDCGDGACSCNECH